MKKLALSVPLLIMSVASAAMNVSAVELDLDNKYAQATLALNDYGAFDSALGFAATAGVPVTGIKMPTPELDLMVETSFNYFGEAEKGIATISGWSVMAAAKPRFMIQDKLYAYAKLGLHYWSLESETKVTTSLFSVNSTASDNGIDLVYGFGGQMHIDQRITVGGEYMIYNFDGGDISSLAATAAYKF